MNSDLVVNVLGKGPQPRLVILKHGGPKPYWIDQLAAIGFDYQPALARLAKSLAASQSLTYFFDPSGLVFVPIGNMDKTSANGQRYFSAVDATRAQQTGAESEQIKSDIHLVAVYTPSHAQLFRDWFEPSIDPSWDFQAICFEAQGDELIGSDFFRQVNQWKTEAVRDALHKHPGEIVILSD